MPTNWPTKVRNTGSPKGQPPTLATDLLDGVAVAFCILLFSWGMQHIVFDYLANPNRPAMLSSTHT
jgi:hypothetical protein